MANEQTSVPLFAASEVLTAANMNLSAGTGVPVFATTVTRDAGFGGANEKVLAEGQLCYLSSTNVVQYYDGAAWATVGPAAAPTSGLTLITTATATAVASISINDCFSSTYAAYQIEIINTTSVGANANFTARLRISGSDATTQYTTQSIYASSSTVSTSVNLAGTDEWWLQEQDPTYVGTFCQIYLHNPNAATKTTARINANYLSSSGSFYVTTTAAAQEATTQFTGITFITAGTSFTGTIRVYGYANS